MDGFEDYVKTEGQSLAGKVRTGKASRVECEAYVTAMEQRLLRDLRKPRPSITQVVINPEHAAADAFWEYWRENGETHRHGYYESTWGAINAAIKAAGVVPREHEEKGDD